MSKLSSVSSLLTLAAAAGSPLWPQPVSSSLGSETLSLSADFSFKLTNGQSSFLDQAIDRYMDIINISEGENASGSISYCALSVSELHENEYETLLPGTDESYQLHINTNGECNIASTTVWGALHAMETFTQLLERSSDLANIITAYAPVDISDSPRFTHRGLLIDSSRHYLPVSEIERIIDTLPMNKFNVLHWHMVDAQVKNVLFSV